VIAIQAKMEFMVSFLHEADSVIKKTLPTSGARQGYAEKATGGIAWGRHGGPSRVCDQLVPSVNQEISNAADKDHGGNSPKNEYWHVVSPHLPTVLNVSNCHLFPTKWGSLLTIVAAQSWRARQKMRERRYV